MAVPGDGKTAATEGALVLRAVRADAAGVDNNSGVAAATANHYAQTAPCRYPCAASCQAPPTTTSAYTRQLTPVAVCLTSAHNPASSSNPRERPRLYTDTPGMRGSLRALAGELRSTAAADPAQHATGGVTWDLNWLRSCWTLWISRLSPGGGSPPRLLRLPRWRRNCSSDSGSSSSAPSGPTDPPGFRLPRSTWSTDTWRS
jgi:hypothetical protein